MNEKKIRKRNTRFTRLNVIQVYKVLTMTGGGIRESSRADILGNTRSLLSAVRQNVHNRAACTRFSELPRVRGDFYGAQFSREISKFYRR